MYSLTIGVASFFSGFNSTGAAGTLTAALGMGGRNAPPAGTSSNVTAEYDGTSWTEINDMASARNASIGTGTGIAAIMIGGNPTTNACEEFTAPATKAVTITSS